DAVEDLRTRGPAKSADRRSAVVVHENVRLRASAEQRRLARGRGDVASDRGHLGAGRLPHFGGGGVEALAVAAVDDDVAARLREREGTRAAKPAAPGADHRPPAR